MSDYGEYKYQQLKEDPDSFVNQKDKVMDKEFKECLQLAAQAWCTEATAQFEMNENLATEFACILKMERNRAKQHWLDKAVEVAEDYGLKSLIGADGEKAADVIADKIKELK